MIRIVTDSNAQMPSDIVDRFGIGVVPLTVTIDGVDHQEGVDLSADDFYARFDEGRRPTVSTSQPSPGSFDDAYRQAVSAGATEILSVHIGSRISGTVNSARIAAQLAPVPVRIVDTGTASFAVALCAWRAAEAVESGSDIESAAVAAQGVSATVGNVFVVGGLDLARRGGRLADQGPAGPRSAGVEGDRMPPAAAGAQELRRRWGSPAGQVEGVPVLTLSEGAMRPVGSADHLGEAAAAMVAHVRGSGKGLRVGVGWADSGTTGLAEAVEHGLRGAPEIAEVVRYRIGPSVGAHTGPGTVGVMFCPV